MGRDSFLWSLSIVGVLAASAAQGFTEPEDVKERAHPQHQIGIRVLRPRLSPSQPAALGLFESSSQKMRLDQRTGAPRVIFGKSLVHQLPYETFVSDDGYRELARRFVEEHRETLGFGYEDLEYLPDATLITDDVQFIKFKLKRDDLIVDDANVDFRFKKGVLVQVVNQSFAEAQPSFPSSPPSQSVDHDGDDLARIAGQALLSRDVTPTGEKYRVIEGGEQDEKDKGGYVLVRVAQFEVKAADGALFQVQVDRATGKIFEIRPRTFHVNGAATQEIHDRWYSQPLAPKASPYLSLSAGSSTVVTDVTGIFANASEDTAPKLNGFTGQYVKVNPQTGSRAAVNGTLVDGTWQVAFTKSGNQPMHDDKTVSQSMVYFHTNAMLQFAKKYITSPWMDRQITANVNLAQSCNAYWDGSTINFFSAGGGCANTGLIADVVYHEWGHGLDANTGGIDDGAYSEGFGDIMSLVMTRSNILGIGFRTNGGPVRDLAPDKVFPKDRGEVHAEGLIIGSTFYDLFQNFSTTYGADVAVDKLSQYAFKTIFTATRYTDVYDALLVVDDNDTDLTNGTPNYCAINATFAAHGLTTADPVCKLAAVDSVEVDDATNGNGNGIIEPGETAFVRVSARNGSTQDLVNLTAETKINTVNGVTLRNGKLAWDSIPARTSALSTTPLEIAVGPNVACGTTIKADFSLTADNRSAAVSKTLQVGRSIGKEEAFAAKGLPLPIKDNRTTTAEAIINGSQWTANTLVQNLRLKFSLKHTYVGDLVVRLVAPNGSTKEVYRGGGPDQDLDFNEDVTALFAGSKGQGSWKLKVSDEGNSDEGTLESLSLEVTPAVFECR